MTETDLIHEGWDCWQVPVAYITNVRNMPKAPDDAEILQVVGDCFVTPFRTLRPLNTIFPATHGP